MSRLYRRRQTWYIDYHDGARRVRRSAGRDEKKARTMLAALDGKRALVRLDLAPAASLLAIAGADAIRRRFESWNDAHRQPNTAKSVRQSLANVFAYVRPATLADLSAESLAAYAAYRAPRATRKTINLELSIARRFCRWAVRQRLVASDPTEGMERVGASGAAKLPRGRRALTQDEAARILAAATPRIRPVLLTALYTGLRRGEIFALTWGDVDLSARRLRVRAATTKTQTGRSVPIPPPLHATLSALAPATRKPSDPVFLQRDGATFSARSQSWLRSLRSTCRRAKIDAHRQIDLHALRYTYGSWLIEAGVNVRVVAALMGHRDPSMTLRIYADAGVMDFDGAAARLPALPCAAFVPQTAKNSCKSLKILTRQKRGSTS